jgi:hypothetical protein
MVLVEPRLVDLPRQLLLLDKLSVSDSGCVVTVCDTGVASLAPQNMDRETDSTHDGRRTLQIHYTPQVIHLTPNCPTPQYLVYLIAYCSRLFLYATAIRH